MKKIKLIFGTHNSQPAGHLDTRFEEAYQNAYKPFLSVLYNFPEMPAVMHFSGILLQWLEEHHAEFLDVLAEMTNRKQVELLGGGFYEPILPLIPTSDRIGQIESLTTFVRKRFGRRPRGSWLAESVWEPSLASSLKNSGMDYTFLDDHNFAAASDGTGAFYPCQTEDQGKGIVVFPVSYPMRYLVPCRPPEEAIAFLESVASEDEEKLVVMLDDGEKFGYRDGTRLICYDEKWLERFFHLVSANAGWLEPILPGRYLRQFTPRRKVYFPCSSYEEMTGWVLPAKQYQELESLRKVVAGCCTPKSFIAGGHFRQFLTKYPESNLMYAKMMYTHILVNQLRGDKYRKKAAREELWRGQCNSAYWHGNTGGLYANHLRKEVYKSLIEAEKVTREKGIFIPSVLSVDFDMDGGKEFLYQGHEVNAYVHLIGGMLFELDYLPGSWNYLDTLSRHQEPYHAALPSPGGFDRYMRKAFIDHFFSEDESIESFDRMTYRESGDFIGEPYELISLHRDHHEILLTRAGTVMAEDASHPVEVKKKYLFRGTMLQVQYTVTNNGRRSLSTIFGCEINLSVLSKESLRLFVSRGGLRDETGPESRETDGVDEVLLEDLYNQTQITLAPSLPCRLWSLPVETISSDHEGFEVTYQSSCLVPGWRLSLAPGESWEVVLTLGFKGQ